MNSPYQLQNDENKNVKLLSSIKEINKFLKNEKLKLFFSFVSILINSAVSIYVPIKIGQIVDQYIAKGDRDNLLNGVIELLIIYAISSAITYFQVFLMGKVGQNVLFKLRSTIFLKLQSLPLSFFNINRAGDLISRINNDTERLNQAFSEVLLRFIGNIFTIIGIGLFMIILNPELGLWTLSVTLVLLIITRILSPLIQKQNKKGLDKFGDLSAEVSESLNNFRVIVAFNRRKYFREAFKKVNDQNYKVSTLTSFLNALLSPIYDYAANIALLIVLVVGINLIISGEISIGLLITFVTYTATFYQPLKIMANLFSQIQGSLAAWNRVSEILRLKSDLNVEKREKMNGSTALLEFKNVNFNYDSETKVLDNVNFKLEEGKTYALVGPTGGGKSTTASLMARLYDPTSGDVFLYGNNLKTYTQEEISSSVGFILQEPILFSGTIADNLIYGNMKFKSLKSSNLEALLKEEGLESIVEKLGDLNKEISQSANSISLGQKQLIAFVRAYLRKPKLLILDEATANIDTVTEALLQKVIEKLPKSTTKVIIAHRLNTIKEADEIFFIANGEIQKSKSYDQVIKKFDTSKSKS